MIRDLLVQACISAFAPEQVGQASDGASARTQCRGVCPDLIILDLELPDCDGLDLLPDLRELAPAAKVIALSSHIDEVTVHRVLQAQIDGFVDKNGQPVDALREAVRVVMEGRQFLSPAVQGVRRALREAPEAFPKLLSDREQEILGLIGHGYTNGEIAERVGLRAVTVQTHRCNIMAKLDIHSTSHLIRYAIEKGFTRVRPASSPAQQSPS